MIVREAEMSEIAEVREMLKEMLEELDVSQAQLEFEMNVRYGFSAIRRKMSVSEEYFLLAEEKKSITGLAVFKPLRSGTASIGKIYVKKPARKKGAGRMLVNFIENSARELGKHKLVILARADNEAALGFYESLGFEREGVLKKHHWGLDYVALGRQIEPADEAEPAGKEPEPVEEQPETSDEKTEPSNENPEPSETPPKKKKKAE